MVQNSATGQNLIILKENKRQIKHYRAILIEVPLSRQAFLRANMSL